MTKCGFDVTRLRSSLSQSQFRVPAAQIDRHFGARAASLLDEIKGFAGIDRAELAGIANKHKHARATQIRQRDHTPPVAVRAHPSLIKDANPAPQCGYPLFPHASIARTPP